MARRRIVAVALAGLTAVAAVLGLAGPAAAHDYIVSSTPAQGQTLTQLPAAFSITANEPLVDVIGGGRGFGIQVTDASGRYYGDGCVSLVDATMSMPATLGAAGNYTLVWQLTSADSHPVSGTIDFVWSPQTATVASTGSTAPPVCGEDATEAPQTSSPGESSTPQSAEASPAEAAAGAATLAWIGGAAVLIVLAVGTTLVLVRPKKKEPTAPK